MTANERIHEITGLCWHEWKTFNQFIFVYSICKKCEKIFDRDNYNFLSLTDGQVLLDWCRANVERECGNCEGSGTDINLGIGGKQCLRCHGSGKLSNLSTICEIVKLLWEGEECQEEWKGDDGIVVTCKDLVKLGLSRCPTCHGTGRITNRPLAWAIWGEVVLEYCQRQEWWFNFEAWHYENHVDTPKKINYLSTFNPLAFCKALQNFLKEK